MKNPSHLQVMTAEFDQPSYRPGDTVKLYVEVADEQTLLISRTTTEQDQHGASRTKEEAVVWHSPELVVDGPGPDWARTAMTVRLDGTLAIVCATFEREVAEMDGDAIWARAAATCPAEGRAERAIWTYVEGERASGNITDA